MDTRAKLLGALEKAGATGLTRAELQKAARLERMTAQQFRRWLAPLIADGTVVAVGTTRGRQYRLATVRPAGRLAVGYRREFLDRYTPNRTFYLDAPSRTRLLALGRTPTEHQPAGTYARQILERLLVDLSWNSSRLEGNTYSLLDTERLVALGEEATQKDRTQTQMILNHKSAIEYLVEGATELALDERTLKNLHAQLADNLLANPMDAGRLRTLPVAIGESAFVPLANPQLIVECFRQVIATAAAVEDPFEQSFFLLVHVPYLQPFIDGNKRTARLAANIPFIQKNLVPLSFVDVSREAYLRGTLSVYEQIDISPLRAVFVTAYEHSAAKYSAVRTSLGEPDPFRLQYRTQIRAAVSEIVRVGLKRSAAKEKAAAFARAALPEAARLRFVVVIEAELDALHDGNFQRYAIRPSEFETWRAEWR